MEGLILFFVCIIISSALHVVLYESQAIVYGYLTIPGSLLGLDKDVRVLVVGEKAISKIIEIYKDRIVLK